MAQTTTRASKSEFLSFLENEGRIRPDSLIEGAIEVAEEVHAGLVREDGKSLFLETHTWPVAMDVVAHYRANNRNITGVEVASAILHDVMEDDERILNLYESKSYGFEAYLAYRFGSKVQRIASDLKIKPIEMFPGQTDDERKAARFWDYCGILAKADYDVKVIKLADRLNNMAFVYYSLPGHEKQKRYMREAEDFYLAYAMIAPSMPQFYARLRKMYEALRSSQKQVAATTV
ncbi:guanosine polyphosphate synthetase/pyrophosphohydrolase [Candidatus Nitrososphaera evergladensis SR1]|jgi:(p)ppGpp synthase/HD superfamily hydrolase|uniref:Guanosine polyphosphate synthetase/pyrophosphohydrolase n=1 Tax=Candidatus Nitrososphaera evergladensis SR1 TaxID=1459636 RepID=A0A075MSG8_9ARCH|nr:HD domain-containing protein [Candidatus Nitrososphaera evergladensis]AIF84526.1 guanosine polyphosphate synthetase/pyrophosphohydrolase [Candidatus Nitrososphaera evergladensis SR1]